jgi:hypothetical protein
LIITGISLDADPTERSVATARRCRQFFYHFVAAVADLDATVAMRWRKA